jgi:hypothetical protein
MTRIVFARDLKGYVPDTGEGSVEALKEMKTLAGGKMLAVVFPFLKPLNDYDKDERAQYESTLSCLNKAGIEYLDLTPQMNAFGKGIVNLREKPDDKLHYNAEGNRLQAEYTYRWLSEKS